MGNSGGWRLQSTMKWKRRARRKLGRQSTSDILDAHNMKLDWVTDQGHFLSLLRPTRSVVRRAGLSFCTVGLW